MNKNSKKILALSLATILLISGCGKIPKLENGQDAVVTIKNGDISVDDLYESVKDRYALSTLIDMIDTQILSKEYKTDDDETDSVQSQINSWLQTFGSEESLLQQTSSYFGVSTMDGLKEYLSLQYKRNKAVEEYAKSIVTDKEINKFYEETIFGDIEVSKILIAPETKDDMTDSEKTAAEEAALKKANEVISKLKAGEKWEDLVKEYTDDESHKDDGGNIGYISHGTLDEDSEKAILKLKKGKYTTTPVKTSYGYEIYLRGSQKDKVKLEKVKDDIIEEIASDKLDKDSTLQITALVELRKKYKVEITDKELKAQYENYIDNSIKRAKENDKNSNS